MVGLTAQAVGAPDTASSRRRAVDAGPREQISVADGVMTITGLPNGDTAGMSTDRSYRQRYGLW